MESVLADETNFLIKCRKSDRVKRRRSRDRGIPLGRGTPENDFDAAPQWHDVTTWLGCGTASVDDGDEGFARSSRSKRIGER